MVFWWKSLAVMQMCSYWAVLCCAGVWMWRICYEINITITLLRESKMDHIKLSIIYVEGGNTKSDNCWQWNTIKVWFSSNKDTSCVSVMKRTKFWKECNSTCCTHTAVVASCHLLESYVNNWSTCEKRDDVKEHTNYICTWSLYI